MEGAGTHWVCYRNLDSMVEYFDPFGLIMPNEAPAYFHTSGKHIVYSMDEIQNRNTVLCGYWCFVLSARATAEQRYSRRDT